MRYKLKDGKKTDWWYEKGLLKVIDEEAEPVKYKKPFKTKLDIV